ncbi:hypothetical protein [Actinocorallia lasiicapitis]
MWYAVRDRLQYSYTDATDVEAYFDQSDPYPDVRVADYDWDANGWLGATFCPANNTGTGGTNPKRWCRGQLVKFNSYYYWKGPQTLQSWENRHHVACHELGHTLGLVHNYSYRNPDYESCLNTWLTSRILRPADITALNNQY